MSNPNVLNWVQPKEGRIFRRRTFDEIFHHPDCLDSFIYSDVSDRLEIVDKDWHFMDDYLAPSQ